MGKDSQPSLGDTCHQCSGTDGSQQADTLRLQAGGNGDGSSKPAKLPPGRAVRASSRVLGLRGLPPIKPDPVRARLRLESQSSWLCGLEGRGTEVTGCG